MVRVVAPQATAAASPLRQSPLVKLASDDIAANMIEGQQIIYTLRDLDFTRHERAGGVYYAYQDQLFTQEGAPLQPTWQELLPRLPTGETARGVLLQAATYRDEPGFTPVIARGWAVGEQRRPMPQAASPTLSGWDHIRPYELGHFVGLSNTVASLNLVLGAFHSEEQRERLFDNMILAVLYSNSADQTSPVITTTVGYMTAAGILLQVIAGDNEQVAQVQGVCDNGTGQWTVVPLAKTGAGWSGYCPADAIRFYSEVADKAGNTVADEWTTPSTEPLVVEVLYLPLIRR